MSFMIPLDLISAIPFKVKVELDWVENLVK